MDNKDDSSIQKETPPSLAEMMDNIRQKNESIIEFCSGNTEKDFYGVEKAVRTQLYQLCCMYLQFYLLSLQDKFDYSDFINSEQYHKGAYVSRTLKTVFGQVCYWRTYYIKKQGGGFYPLDAMIGLTRDGFSPLVMSLAAKLATRMSFATSALIFKYIHEWSPSSEAIQGLVQGMGRDAPPYMEQREAPEDDGEILIIEVDGKATPTATLDELKKRGAKRDKKKKSCCKRHRNKDKRQRCHKKGKNRRKKKSDKRKNGRSITLVVIYTLKKGEDGKLHGPINKQVWGSYAPRKVMLAWARNQATKRGFPPDTSKRIHIAIDGEICLYDGLVQLFPKATFALDIRHLEEKIWDVGYALYNKDSPELLTWIDDVNSN